MAIERYWLTGLSVLIALFLFALGVSAALGADDFSDGDRVGLTIYGVLTGSALLAGLCLLRVGTSARMATVLITIGLAAALVAIWIIIPPTVAAVVFFFGIVRGGLARELRPSAAA